MKIYLVLSDGEQIEITKEEAAMLPDMLENNKFIRLSRLDRTISSYRVQDIKSEKPIQCYDCGNEFYPSQVHSCTTPDIQAMIDALPDASNELERLKNQLRHMRKGLPAQEAYEKAWGKLLGKSPRQEQEDEYVQRGIAKKQGNGIGFIRDKLGIVADEARREYAKMMALDDYQNYI